MFVTAVEMMGFGTDEAGVSAFTASSSLLGDLGGLYVAAWVGHLITIGAAISAFACALACGVSAARMLFALSRDGIGPTALARISPARGIPTRATIVVVSGMYVIVGLTWFVLGGEPFELFVASGTIGMLILLVGYALATIGAARLLFFSRCREVATWEIVVPTLALVLLGYTLVRNVLPYPEGIAGVYPAISTAWILLGVIWVVARPSAAQRAGQRLTSSEGLSTVAPAS